MKIVYLATPLKLKEATPDQAGVEIDVIAVGDDFAGVIRVPQLDIAIDLERYPHAVQSFGTEQAAENALANHVGKPYFLDVR